MATDNANSRQRPYDVLLVEDNPDDAELFLRSTQKTQTDLGTEIRVRVVADSTQASVQLKALKFDVIFLDFGLPPPDGIELTKHSRGSVPNRTTPIVMLTGTEDRGLMARAFQAGANWFLSKPVDRSRLLHLFQVSRGPIEREKRAMQRVQVKCKVSMEVDGVRIKGETQNISLSGMLVRADRVLPIGSSIKLNVALSATAPSLQTTARVIRVVGSDSMGLELQHVGKAESDKLVEFLLPLIVAAQDEKETNLGARP